MLLKRFHLALAGAAAAVVVLGFVAGASVWHLEAAAREVLFPTPPGTPSPAFIGPWIVGGLTLAALAGLIGASYSVSVSFRRSLAVLWDVIDDVQAGRLIADSDDADEVASLEGEVGDDELRRAAHALRRTARTLSEHTVSRSYLHDVLDSMEEMLFVTDADGRIRHVNRAATEALNTTTDGLTGTMLRDLFDTDPLAATSDTAVECRLTAVVGSSRPVLVSRSELRRAPGETTETVCVAQDVSALKDAEAALQQSVEEKDVLLREVHHRVTNNLQIVGSLLHAEERSVHDPEVRRRFAAVQHRIRSMSTIHEQLYRSDDLSQVDFGAYLRDLSVHLASVHDRARTSLRVDAEPVHLPLATAIPAGIIVNELVVNAFEHAQSGPSPAGDPDAPDDLNGDVDGNPGRDLDETLDDDLDGELDVTGDSEAPDVTVTVAFRASGSDALLRVCDDGVGPESGWAGALASRTDPDAGTPAPSGVGLRLVRGLTRQLRGTVNVSAHRDRDGGGDGRTDGGTCVDVSFPLDADVSDSEVEPVSA